MIEDSLHEATANAEATEDCDEKVEAYEDAIDDITSLSEDVDKIYGNTPKTQTEDEDEE
jgi:hypothetical protein